MIRKPIETLFPIIESLPISMVLERPSRVKELLMTTYDVKEKYAMEVINAFLNKIIKNNNNEVKRLVAEPLPSFSRDDREMKEIKPKRIDTMNGKIILTFESQMNFNL